MTDEEPRDFDAKASDESDDESHCNLAQPEQMESMNDTAEDEDDEEEDTVEIEITRSQAVFLMHVAWEKELEYAEDKTKMALSSLMGNLSSRVGEELYNEETTEWMQKRHEKQKERINDMKNRMMNQKQTPGSRTFQ